MGAPEVRPWGRFEVVRSGPGFTVKLLHVDGGSRLSLQYHRHRSEYWRVLRGRILATVGGRVGNLVEGESVEIPVRVPHRLWAVVDTVILEVATGRFDEADIVRMEDDYGRATDKKPIARAAHRGTRGEAWRRS